MKLLVLLLFIGVASASLYDALDDAADEVVREFMAGLEHGPSLKEALGLADSDYIDEAEDEVKTELGKKLKETLDRLLENIKDSVEQGKALHEDVLKKLKEVREKLKELKLDVGTKARELVEKIKEKGKDYFKKLLDLFGLNSPDRELRSLDKLDFQRLDFNIKEIFQKLKKAILDKIDKEALTKKIEELFGKGNEIADQLRALLKEKGEKYKEKILDFIDRFLGEKEERRRSVSEKLQKVKDAFGKLNRWLKEKWDKARDTAKDKLEHFKQRVKEVVQHLKDLKAEIAAEFVESLRPYKDDLGTLWDDIKEEMKKILNRKEE